MIYANIYNIHQINIKIKIYNIHHFIHIGSGPEDGRDSSKEVIAVHRKYYCIFANTHENSVIVRYIVPVHNYFAVDQV